VWLAFTSLALLLMPWNTWTLAVVGGSTAMFALGMLDDLRPLRADMKLLAQLGISAGVAALGVKVGVIPIPAIAIPVTLFWMVGLTNAVNLIDNMDGLAPAVSSIAGGFLGVLALVRGDVAVAVLSFSLAGACAGFLVFNVPPARAFLGDAGSLFIGFALASIGILSTWEEASSLLMTLALPVLVLCVPIFNTTFVTVTRLLLRVPISKGQGDHINYRLVAHGLSPKQSVAMVCCLAFAGGGLAVLYTRMDNDVAVAIAIVTTVMAFVLGAFLFEGDISALYKRFEIESDTSLADAVRRYRSVMMMMLDVALLSAAYFFAYLLRFEADIPPNQFDVFLGTLPLFLVVRLVALTGFGLYQRYWRYVSVSDLSVLAQALLLSSLAEVGVIFIFRIPMFSRSVLILDLVFCFLLLGGVRISTRLLKNYVHRFRAQIPGQATLIVGAGDAGELVLRELRNNPSLGLRAIGLLDDDPAKRRIRIHGVPVLGSTSELASVVDRHGADNLILAIPSASLQLRKDLLLEGDRLGLQCHEYWVTSTLRKVEVRQDETGGASLSRPLAPTLVPGPDRDDTAADG
jgi:UDP-GlcNAc:undecaprenyl-phosphate GlcNAc-1-phosphate transferase